MPSLPKLHDQFASVPPYVGGNPVVGLRTQSALTQLFGTSGLLCSMKHLASYGLQGPLLEVPNLGGRPKASEVVCSPLGQKPNLSPADVLKKSSHFGT